MDVSLVSASSKRQKLTLRLTEPLSDEETCGISLQPMREAEPPLAETHPLLRCAELPCGHRFAAAPLLTHFALNDMRCPMCRAGSRHRMAPTLSLGQEVQWATRLEAQMRHTEEEGNEPLRPFQNQALFLMMTEQEDESSLPALMATIRLYAQSESLTAVYQFPLIARPVGASLRPRFQMPSTSARELAESIVDVQARAMDVDVGIVRSVMYQYPRSLQTAALSSVTLPAGRASFFMNGNRLRILSPGMGAPSFIYAPCRRVMERFMYL